MRVQSIYRPGRNLYLSLDIKRLFGTILLLIFFVVLLRNAWLCDDAYITFRTIDNFVNGYGLTWNTVERVQSYTHPAWMLMLALVYFFTHEIYYTSIIVSVIISLLAVWLLIFRIARSWEGSLLGVLLLLFSKAFIDFSTSGLENPLSHLLLTIFVYCHIKHLTGDRKTILLSLVSSFLAVNRMDLLLISLPTILYDVIISNRRLKSVLCILIGLTPLVLWECFSVFYYGFAVPNTAYAKLNTGIGAEELFAQGICYLMNSINLDPITLIAIGLGIIYSLLVKDRTSISISIGIISYLLYVVKIGGDFMSGRFLTAPLLCAVLLLIRTRMISVKSLGLPFIALIMLVGLSSPYSPLFSTVDYGIAWKREGTVDKNGISDERAFYYRSTGLLRAARNTEWPLYFLPAEGRNAQVDRSHVIVWDYIGLFGFYNDSDEYIIDRFALTEPLLARLPAIYTPNWRIGHFARTLPKGYIETLINGNNLIEDPKLATYYDKLALITRGDLSDFNRLIEIWKINIGTYQDLIDNDIYRYPDMLHLSLSDVSAPKGAGTTVDQAGILAFTSSGVQIDLQKEYHAQWLETSLDNNDSYRIIYFRRGNALGQQDIRAVYYTDSTIDRVTQHRIPPGLALHVISVPQGIRQQGYDRIRILPLHGDDIYRLGHVRLIP